MSDVEVAWVAGLLEGEGSFTLGATKTTGVRQIQVTCSMTDEDTIQKLMWVTGAGNYNREGRRDPRRRNAKPLFCWRVSKRSDVVDLMIRVYPYMSARRSEKIDFLLTYAEDNPLRNHRKGESVPHGTVTGYKWHKCKCDLCKEAMNEYARVYRAHKAAARTAVD